MILFLSDLDNTLIYSYKREIGEDKVLVETKDGKELAYMTRTSSQLLERIQSRLQFIPVTTRSMDQYRRIQLSSTWQSEYALVANGGILLRNNRIVDEWYKESLDSINVVRNELMDGMQLLKEDTNISFDIRLVDDLFVFTKSDSVEDTLSSLRNRLDLSKVEVFSNFSKIYILPKSLTKGSALERIKQKFKPELVVAAGDSIFDIPMIEKADISIMPSRLEEYVKLESEGKLVVDDGQIYSDVFLKYIWGMIE